MRQRHKSKKKLKNATETKEIEIIGEKPKSKVGAKV